MWCRTWCYCCWGFFSVVVFEWYCPGLDLLILTIYDQYRPDGSPKGLLPEPLFDIAENWKQKFWFWFKQSLKSFCCSAGSKMTFFVKALVMQILLKCLCFLFFLLSLLCLIFAKVLLLCFYAVNNHCCSLTVSCVNTCAGGREHLPHRSLGSSPIRRALLPAAPWGTSASAIWLPVIRLGSTEANI